MAPIVTSTGKKAQVAPANLVPIDLFRAGTAEKIAFIKKGVPARTAKFLIKGFKVDQKVMLDALSLKTATINRKATNNEVLSADESERVIGLAELLGQVEAMVEESGDPNGFDANAWLADWLRQPLPALGGEKPIEYLDTMKGQMLISKLLLRMQTGAYS